MGEVSCGRKDFINRDCGGQLPCFKNGATTVVKPLLREQLQLAVGHHEVLHELTTKLYDNFQYITESIL